MGDGAGAHAEPLALTMGEPSGIGPDITLAAWLDRRALNLPAFYCLADPALLADRARMLGVDCPIETIADPREAAACFARALPVVALDATVKAVAVAILAAAARRRLLLRVSTATPAMLAPWMTSTPASQVSRHRVGRA